MGTVDNATWMALGLTLTLLGLAASFVAYKRRGLAAGLRGVAWSLLPLAAALTHTLQLLWDIADSVASWATRLVFSPSVWLGLMVGVLSLLLFVVSARLHRRASGASPGKKVAGSPPSAAVARGGGDDDLADIEAILRKHGIS